MQKTAKEVALAITSHNQNTNENNANAKHKQPQTAPKKLCTRHRKQQQQTKRNSTIPKKTKTLNNFSAYNNSEGKSQSLSISKPQQNARTSLPQRGCR
jgi:hypothetical protein